MSLTFVPCVNDANDPKKLKNRNECNKITIKHVKNCNIIIINHKTLKLKK